MNKLLKTVNRWIAKSKLHWYDFSRLYLWSKQSKLRAAWALPLGFGVILPISLTVALIGIIVDTVDAGIKKFVLQYVQKYCYLIPNPEVESAAARIDRQEYIQRLKDQYIEQPSK